MDIRERERMMRRGNRECLCDNTRVTWLMNERLSTKRIPVTGAHIEGLP